jgi:hypothetical protein
MAIRCGRAHSRALVIEPDCQHDAGIRSALQNPGRATWPKVSKEAIGKPRNPRSRRSRQLPRRRAKRPQDGSRVSLPGRRNSEVQRHLALIEISLRANPVGFGAHKSKMKRILAVLALCASAQGALAAGPDCRAIERSGERLACYDAASAPKKDKPASVETDASRAAYQDPLIAEDARIAAKLKNICRGC